MLVSPLTVLSELELMARDGSKTNMPSEISVRPSVPQTSQQLPWFDHFENPIRKFQCSQCRSFLGRNWISGAAAKAILLGIKRMALER